MPDAPTPPAGMKFIEDYRDTYKDSTFWIIGSDPNLDHYPDNFFEDKFSIAVTASCIAFPQSTFLFTQYKHVADAIRDARPDFLKRMILRFFITAPPQAGIYTLASWTDYGLDPIYTRPNRKGVAGTTLEVWKGMVKQIFEGAGEVEFVAVHTIVSFVIGIAAVLGAKRIVLVGCGARTTKYLFHAQKRGMWMFCREKPGYEYPADFQSGEEPGTLKPMREEVQTLAEMFRGYGVEIVKHRYDEGTGEFVFVEI